MYLSCCNVWISTTWPSCPGVGRQPGANRRPSELNSRWHRIWEDAKMTAAMPAGIIPGGQVHGIWTDSTEGVRSPSTDLYITEGIHWLEGLTYLPPTRHHLQINKRLSGLENGHAEAMRMPAADVTLEKLQADRTLMNQYIWESKEEQWKQWIQLANTLTLQVRVALAAPKG